MPVEGSHARLARFTIALTGVAAIEWLALWFAGWAWRTSGDTLQAIEAGGSVFYAPWIALLLGGFVFAPAQASPDLVLPAFRGARDVAYTLAVLAALAWFYSHGLGRLASGGALPAPSPMVASAAILAPVAEEWIFRSVLWRQLAPAGASWQASGLALVATSIAFGFWHLPFDGHAPIALHAAFGALMGLVRWRSGSALPCMVLHGVGNLLSFVRAA